MLMTSVTPFLHTNTAGVVVVMSAVALYHLCYYSGSPGVPTYLLLGSVGSHCCSTLNNVIYILLCSSNQEILLRITLSLSLSLFLSLSLSLSLSSLQVTATWYLCRNDPVFSNLLLQFGSQGSYIGGIQLEPVSPHPQWRKLWGDIPFH